MHAIPVTELTMIAIVQSVEAQSAMIKQIQNLKSKKRFCLFLSRFVKMLAKYLEMVFQEYFLRFLKVF